MLVPFYRRAYLPGTADREARRGIVAVCETLMWLDLAKPNRDSS
jgi:hypothetical protein